MAIDEDRDGAAFGDDERVGIAVIVGTRTSSPG